MINLIRKYNICANKPVILSISRSLVSSSKCEIRVSDFAWRRRFPQAFSRQIPLVHGKLLKDSDFEDLEVDTNELDTAAGHLERSYDEHISEVKEQKRKLRRILTKKSINKYPKQPNMLTFSEREHIKFLHESDPVEWSVERLSQSFPALPYVIKKILKNKWKPSSLEKIKLSDAQVLENWNKLRRNELKATPFTLNHLKKFLNKQENLKVQLENPHFFPEPEVPQKVSWGDGPLSALIKKYEMDIKKLKNRHFEGLSINDAENTGDMLAVSEKPLNTIEEDIKIEFESRENKCDNFMIGKSKSRGTTVTLHDLKRSILEKTEKGNQPLSKFEEALLDKTLKGDRRLKENVKVKEETEHRLKNVTEESYDMEKQLKVRSNNVSRDMTEGKVNKNNNTQKIRQFGDKEETDQNLRIDDETHYLKEENLGQFLQRLKDEVPVETKVKEKVIKEKTPKTAVKFYGTEKDQAMVQRDFDLVYDSCFWSSSKTQKKNQDTLSLEEFTTNTKASPHLSPTLKTYFTCDYPDKVEIPKDKWVKGMTYRVNDCYYDDDGEFLYRVPGITEN